MSLFRILVGAIFSFAVVAAPWPIGGNWPFARTAILCLTLLTLCFALLDKNAKRPLARFPLIWILLILGAGYGIFQATSPSAALNAIAGGPVPFAKVEPNEAQPISVYPAATREKMVDLLMGIGLFFASTVLLRERKRILPVLVSLTVVGVVLSFFGVVQNLSWNGKLFWQYELLNGGQPFGSFVNRNNAAGFLIVTFSASIFFIAYQMFSWNRENEPQGLMLAENHWESEQKSKNSLSNQFLEWFAELQPKHLYSAAAVAVIFAGVFATLSRGGMVALLATCFFVVLILARTNKRLVAILTVGLALVGTGFVVYSNQSSEISDQIQSLSELESAAAPRLMHWQDAWPFAMDHLALGSGLGSYRYCSNSFQSFFYQRTFAHAENIYLETLVELGMGGVILLLLCIAYCGYTSIKLMRRREIFDRALGVCGLACLIGQSIASSVDFGLYQPANTLVMAVLMGCVVGRAATEIESRPVNVRAKSTLGKIVLKVTLIGVILSCGWATWESSAVESRKRAARTLDLINEFKTPQSRFTSKSSFKKIQSNLEFALSVRPDDSEAHFEMGQYYLACFQTEATYKLDDQIKEQIEAARENGAVVKDVDISTVWLLTTPSSIHREYRMAQRRDPRQAEILKYDETLQKFLPQAWEQFVAAERTCPLRSKTRFRLAELSALFEPGTEASHIQAALSRTLNHTRLMFSCGLLSLNSGDQKTAAKLWSQCLANPNSLPFERPIVETSLAEFPMRVLYEEVLPQDPAKLIQIAQKYFNPAHLKLPKQLLMVHTKQLIAKTDLSSVDRFFYSAEACRLSDEFEPAADWYRQALELDPNQVLWRFDYARSLHQTGEFEEAIRQLKICELEPSRIHSNIKPLLARIRRDRANQQSTRLNFSSSTL